MPPKLSEDYQTEADLHALMTAKEVEATPARLDAVRTLAERKRDFFTLVAEELPKPKKRQFNNAVKNSRFSR